MDSNTEGVSLPLSFLRLLVPPIRLMSAFMWQVAQQRDVMQYGKLVEFVTLVTEMVPELLHYRQRAQLILGLNARFVLELCCGTENEVLRQTIQPHLDRIQSCTLESKLIEDKYNEVEASKSNFVKLVQTLLEDATKKKYFFQEVFPVQYGSKYDTSLQILVWEFFSRLEELLPVPSFTQTSSCLCLAPSDLCEFWDSVSDLEHLKILLQHQRHKGLLNRDNFFYNSDTILSSMTFTFSVNFEDQKCHNNREKEQTDGNVINQKEINYSESNDADEILYAERFEEAGGTISAQQTPGPSQETCPVVVNEKAIEMPTLVYSQSPFSLQIGMNNHQHFRKEHLTEEDNRRQLLEGANNSLPSIETVKSSLAKATKKYVCFKCGKGFRSPSDLKRHQGVHTGMRPFHCNQCEKRFKSKGSLKQHQRVHTGERPYVCSLCGCGFRTSDILKSHVRIHTGERPYVCTVCGKRFIQQPLLTRHFRMHTGERPYLCSICGKTFPCSGELTVHSRVHTGERPYHCEQCEKTFNRLMSLKVHQRSHTGERPYLCKHCPKCFSTSKGLVQHIRTHTGEKPYQCFKCGKRFSERGNMKIHHRSCIHEK